MCTFSRGVHVVHTVAVSDPREYLTIPHLPGSIRSFETQVMSASPPHASTDDTPSSAAEQLPQTCLPTWEVADLPEPLPIEWKHWTRMIGPAIVMMGMQIGGGEWLLGPEVTAKYGGGLMWLATIAILLQVFY